MRDKLFKGLYFITAIALIIAMFITTLDICCFRKSFYNDFYRDNQTAQTMNISQDDLNAMTDTLLDYLKDERDDLNVLIEVEGQSVQGFNQREKDHMVDVKELYLNVIKVDHICLIVFVAGFLVLAMADRKACIKAFYDGYKNASVILVAILIALGLYAVMDFNSFWTNFHHVFFRNDLWLLNPATDRLIMMVPGNFFFVLVTQIILAFLLVWLIVLIGLYLLKRRFKNA